MPVISIIHSNIPSAQDAGNVHQGVREAHFGAVNGTISDTLEERQERRQIRVLDQGVQVRLYSNLENQSESAMNTAHTTRASMVSRCVGPR